jgi:hypothetical protein
MLSARTWNIALRTAHIAAMGILLGGHWFEQSRQALVPSLWACVGTGVALGLLETGGSTVWLHQGRGLMTIAKLGLLCAVPLFGGHWHVRVALLLTVVVLASVGSHMPARYRYYSVIFREVVPCRDGPGTANLGGEDGEASHSSGDE